ncbi:hypothetical protein C8J57DRAFT_1733834 [Mycena rebaudengoi]|nr:hypothetical protein C8J57DRAFT_1733834 [Mycena rebaudengoi]
MMIYHDSISTTYRLSNGTTKAIKRGSNQSADNLKSVVLNDNGIVSQISGFAGLHEAYNQNLFIRVQFVILDTQTGAIRVAGVHTIAFFPAFLNFISYRNAIAIWRRCWCLLFSVSNPMALAGFETAGSPQTGISGLSIVKNNMAE